MQQDAEKGDLFVGGDLQRLDDFLSSDDSVVGADSAGNLTTMLQKRLFSKGWTNPITYDTLSSATALHRIWSGIIGMTANQVPIVGIVPTSVSDRSIEGGGWIAAVFNGYGMCQAWLSGQAIARMALGEPKPEWLPDVYLSSEKRLIDKVSMIAEAALASFSSGNAIRNGLQRMSLSSPFSAPVLILFFLSLEVVYPQFELWSFM
jgi:hypothetical protein